MIMLKKFYHGYKSIFLLTFRNKFVKAQILWIKYYLLCQEREIERNAERREREREKVKEKGCCIRTQKKILTRNFWLCSVLCNERRRSYVISERQGEGMRFSSERTDIHAVLHVTLSLSLSLSVERMVSFLHENRM